jgi:hypothetical protein
LAEGDVFATWSDYNEMINSLRLRAADLNLSGADADRISGLPERYAQKLLGPGQVRRLGACSLGPFLGALCLKGQFVVDEEAERRLKNRVRARNVSYARPTQTYVTVTNRKWSKIQKLGNLARWSGVPPQQRSDMMRALTLKRWRRLSKKQRSELMRALVLKRWRGP